MKLSGILQWFQSHFSSRGVRLPQEFLRALKTQVTSRGASRPKRRCSGTIRVESLEIRQVLSAVVGVPVNIAGLRTDQVGMNDNAGQSGLNASQSFVESAYSDSAAGRDKLNVTPASDMQAIADAIPEDFPSISLEITRVNEADVRELEILNWPAISAENFGTTRVGGDDVSATIIGAPVDQGSLDSALSDQNFRTESGEPEIAFFPPESQTFATDEFSGSHPTTLYSPLLFLRSDPLITFHSDFLELADESTESLSAESGLTRVDSLTDAGENSRNVFAASIPELSTIRRHPGQSSLPNPVRPTAFTEILHAAFRITNSVEFEFSLLWLGNPATLCGLVPTAHAFLSDDQPLRTSTEAFLRLRYTEEYQELVLPAVMPLTDEEHISRSTDRRFQLHPLTQIRRHSEMLRLATIIGSVETIRPETVELSLLPSSDDIPRELKYERNPRGPPEYGRDADDPFAELNVPATLLERLRYSIAPRGPSLVTVKLQSPEMTSFSGPRLSSDNIPIVLLNL